MPKIIDNYILERKIGAGQFGEVFKGVNKVTGQDVAVKVIKRELLKGKFTELLENEIRVLRTCNNINIIKLYDLKKTSNNFYLVLEYCNEGDLSDFLKSKKQFSEEEATNFFIQILNAFKTLVKQRIMHRDFKLANILKHNGMVKIADFGFCKLLGNQDFTQTMLGSPLNMAPEVLEGREYNNKADIWSIGTVYFEMLFGKPPFIAQNILELVKTIKSKPLQIPKKPKISVQAEDVLRRMLTVDPEDRIGWDELFTHKINSYQEDKLKKELEDTLKGTDLQANFSRFYIKNNQVINHPSEIEQKKEINDFAINMARGKQTKEEAKYAGPMVARRTDRDDDEDKVKSPGGVGTPVVKDQEEEKDVAEELSKEETPKERKTRVMKKNSNVLLHERNKYVFLASVSEDAIGFSIKYGELAAFMMIKKLFLLLGTLKSGLDARANILNLELWEEYMKSSDYHDISAYISKEYDVFKVYYESLHQRMTESLRDLDQKELSSDILSAITLETKLTQSAFGAAYNKILMLYCKEIVSMCRVYATGKSKSEDDLKGFWAHADHIIDCLQMDEVFKFEVTDKAQFNFKRFYEEPKMLDYSSLATQVETRFKSLK